MAKIFNAPWEDVDRIALNKFLSTDSGKRFLLRMSTDRPTMEREKSTEAQAMIAREAIGWENCVDHMGTLCAKEPISP